MVGDVVASTLDTAFGELRLPFAAPGAKPYWRWEKNFTPFSMMKLDAWNARYLKEVMGEIVDGWRLGNVLFFDAILIWTVDKEGVIRYAIEELVQHNLPTNIPKHQNFSLTRRMPKLGHPALVSGESSRIAGEIKPVIGDGGNFLWWEINNKSGRYGLYRSRTMDQLENVSGEFYEYGIELRPRFIQGKN